MTLPDGRSVVLLHRTITGRNADGNAIHGNTVIDIPVGYTGLPAFAPSGSTEIVNGQDTVTDTPQLFLPPGLDVTAIDAALIDGTLDGDNNPLTGELYEITGEPAVWVSPFGGIAPKGTALNLTRVSG